MVQEPRPDRHSTFSLIAAVLATVLAAGGGYWLGRASGEPAPPAPTSAEAGFARDMQVHHTQGVELSLILRDRTSDEDIRRLAYDIATTQGHQAGQLYGWLAAWGLNQMGSEPPMTWMGHGGHAMNALMPGMATREQIAELSAASGVDAERIFLVLMIAHHRSALDMAAAVLARTSNAVVTSFARAVVSSQQSEIDLMTRMLEERNKLHP